MEPVNSARALGAGGGSNAREKGLFRKACDFDLLSLETENRKSVGIT